MRIPFDIIGSREKAIAVITDINMHISKAKQGAKEIMSRYKHVKAVIQKTSKRKSKFRIYNYRHLVGVKRLTVIHKEYGYKLKVNPVKVHFSPREGEERERVANKVKNNEKILYLFAGAAPYAVAIRKKKMVEIVCVEWNPYGIKLAKENIKLNKLSGITVKKMDARDCTKLGKFDRVLMPLGTEGIKYLKYAVKCTKKNGVIHIYGKSDDNGKTLRKQIKKIVKCKILRQQKVSSYSPGVEKIRMDIRI
jgi:tRNA (guanine37-N1)-methyltransferase